MAWPASGPGRLLERYGDVAPRGMTVHDKTRLIGRLRRFFCPPGRKSPKVLHGKTLGPRPLAFQFPAPVGAPPLLKGAVALRIYYLARCASWLGEVRLWLWAALWLLLRLGFGFDCGRGCGRGRGFGSCCGFGFGRGSCLAVLFPFSRLRGKVPGGRMGGDLALAVGQSQSKAKAKARPNSPLPNPPLGPRPKEGGQEPKPSFPISTRVSPRKTPSGPKRRSWMKPPPSWLIASRVLARVP